ncbi:MAG: hypothetical protein ACKPKO_48545 [Candidatus Fonsibacter sp.]
MMDQQVPWSNFKKVSVDIENKVDGYFPLVSGHMAQQGIEAVGWDDWAQADLFVASYVRNVKLRDKFLKYEATYTSAWAQSSQFNTSMPC